MHDDNGQQLIAEIVAPMDAPDMINTLAEARDQVSFIRDHLTDYQTQGIPGIGTELDRVMGILIACEAQLLAIARRDGLPLRGLVGDTIREELARGIIK